MINRNNFILEDIPMYHPESLKYLDWWRDQKKKCIEGFWSSGYWMPGNLYFYINFGTILVNKTEHATSKEPGRPILRDLEWEFFYNWAEARGFSGFVLDEQFTCNRNANPSTYLKLSDFERNRFIRTTPNAFKPDGSLKTYVEARDYLRKQHPRALGYPLFENMSKDMMMLGSRGFGKSYSVGVGIILHEWLFDGQTTYIPASEQKVAPKSVTVVGAGDGKYSTDLLLKTSFALDFLPGNQQIGNRYYPCPFTKKFKGSWNTNNNIIAKYKKKVGGEWKNLGTFSEIKHRSFKDNPFAANGIRAGAMIFEEIGMFDNLIASRNASVECQQDGAIKFGSSMFLGTGGDMDRGTIDASIMFNDPEGFNLLQFDDVWENRGKIGYFVPAYRGLNQYKDDNGFTIEEPARHYLEAVRKTLRESKSGSSAIDEELQNRPLVPSEVFLTKKGNLFPIDSLRKRQVSLESDDNYKLLEKPVELFFDKELPGGVGYKLDLESKLRPLNNFPLSDKQKSDRNGCVVIYEFPMEIDGVVPKDMYLIGHDPYASDDPDGESLGAIYVIKNKKYISKGYDEIVASFIGRPEQGRWVVNENLYKLSLFYGGCKIYFENIRGNTLEYFEKIRRLDLLAAQPETILNKKSATRKSGSTIYGYPMSNDKMKAEGVLYLRDWLVEERGTGVKGEVIRNLDLIPDKALLQELIAFNYTGNFDRVMAFMGCMFGLEESHNRYVRHVDSDTKNTLDFLHNNRLIRNKKKPIIEDDHNE